MERLSEKRKRDPKDEDISPTRRRNNGQDTIQFLREKSAFDHQLKLDELEIRRKELELREKRDEAQRKQSEALTANTQQQTQAMQQQTQAMLVLFGQLVNKMQ